MIFDEAQQEKDKQNMVLHRLGMLAEVWSTDAYPSEANDARVVLCIVLFCCCCCWCRGWQMECCKMHSLQTIA